MRNRVDPGIYVVFSVVLTVACLLFTITTAENKIHNDAVKICRLIRFTTPGSCKEYNLRLYWWFRSKNVHPDVVIGTINGRGHLWVEYSGRIYDATNLGVTGKRARDITNYKKAKYEFSQY